MMTWHFDLEQKAIAWESLWVWTGVNHISSVAVHRLWQWQWQWRPRIVHSSHMQYNARAVEECRILLSSPCCPTFQLSPTISQLYPMLSIKIASVFPLLPLFSTLLVQQPFATIHCLLYEKYSAYLDAEKEWSR